MIRVHWIVFKTMELTLLGFPPYPSFSHFVVVSEIFSINITFLISLIQGILNQLTRPFVVKIITVVYLARRKYLDIRPETPCFPCWVFLETIYIS